MTQLWDSHTNLLNLEVSGEVTDGIYSLSIEKYNGSVHMIASSRSSRQLLPPWVGSHVRRDPVDANQVSNVPVFWLLEEELKVQEVWAQVELSDNKSLPIPLTDDGLLSPDLVARDSLFSGAFYALISKGWCSPLLNATTQSNLATNSSLKQTRVTAGQAFYTREPLTEPPSPAR